MTPAINTDGPDSSPRVILVEKQGCWPFRRVRKHKSDPLNDLARRTLRPVPHPSYNDPIVVIHDGDAMKRSPGCEDITTLAQQLQEGSLFSAEDIAEAKRIQSGEL